MSRLVSYVLILITALMLVSCSTVNRLNPFKQKDFRDPKQNYLFIVIDTDSSFNELALTLQDEIEYRFPPYNLNIATCLDSSKLIIEDSTATLSRMLVLRQTANGVFVANHRNTPGYSGIEFRMDMYDGDQRTWREFTRVLPAWESFTSEEMAELIVDDVLQKMIRDKKI